jgi:DNA topoisomerase I
MAAAKQLLIVESPGKIKTISKYLGSDVIVEASYGHVRDLPKSGMNIDVEGDFTPHYDIIADKKSRISALKKNIKKDTIVWLAMDADREGEAIAWHLYEALKLTPEQTKRITFTEITKNGVLEAMKIPRTIDNDLVDAQQARRILDRIVGYELSPLLWKKIARGLSAGRVQSVAVRLIVDRERDIMAFESEKSFKVTGIFLNENKEEIAVVSSKNFKGEKEAYDFLSVCQKATYSVEKVEKKPGKRSPTAPFTTSTLQQEAARKFGFSVKQTMVLAQKLYEAGVITYMRTDSLYISKEAQTSIHSYINKTFGKDYLAPRVYKTKSAGAQEAHEAIRPTNVSNTQGSKDPQIQKLYSLIWKRTIASQMSAAEIEKTLITINVYDIKNVIQDTSFQAKGEIVQFDGFLKIYTQDAEGQSAAKDEGLLPAIAEGESLWHDIITAKEHHTKPVGRYTEATLVKELEKKGIGRPSTYAPTIGTIQTRGYIEKASQEPEEKDTLYMTLKKEKLTKEVKQEMTGGDKNKLFPTDAGILVTDFLVEHFGSVIDYNFTANIENDFDKIADGKKQWKKMLKEFYGEFHPLVADKTESLSRSEVSNQKVLGIDPKSGKELSVRLGQYGPFAQIGTRDDEDKPKFASLKKDQRLDTITLEEALDLFSLPRTIGKTDGGEDITVTIGRFGPYIKAGKLSVSLRKEHDPYTLEFEEAIILVREKEETEKNRIIHIFEKSGIEVLNGRYGAYITDGKKNGKIPKDTDPKKLTEKECKDILKKAPDKKKRSFGRKKK